MNKKIEEDHWFFSTLENKASCYESLKFPRFQPRNEFYKGHGGLDWPDECLKQCTAVAKSSKNMVDRMIKFTQPEESKTDSSLRSSPRKKKMKTTKPKPPKEDLMMCFILASKMG